MNLSPPDYTQDNIVNLASSILKTFGSESPYPALNELNDLSGYTNVILLLIDGLGYDYLMKYGQDSLLKEYTIKKISTVFPSTTASAVTTLETGVAPQQHGITGWFMYLKELGLVSKILPFSPRYGGQSFPNNEIFRGDIYMELRIHEKIEYKSYMIYPDDIIDGKVNRQDQHIIPYKNLREMMSLIVNKASEPERKYIYAYWDRFDSLCHENGTGYVKVLNHFRVLDREINILIKALKGTNTALIITADHGLINAEKFKIIYLNDFPDIYDTLTLPLCGEPRLAYCYVHPEKTHEFEENVIDRFGHCCDLYKSGDLINNNFFGLYKPHRMLKHRVGDYVLIMKENYIIYDALLKERRPVFKGNHGGMSSEEIYVPLIYINDI